MHLMKNRSITDRGVSEVIGSILLISVVVLAIAIIGVALTSQTPPEKLPAVSAVISGSGNQVSLYHDGGDTLASSEVSILVNGNPVPFTKSGSPAPWTWSVGDTLELYIKFRHSPDRPDRVHPCFVYDSVGRFYLRGIRGSPVPFDTFDYPPDTTSLRSHGFRHHPFRRQCGNDSRYHQHCRCELCQWRNRETHPLTAMRIFLSPAVQVSSPTQITGGTVNLAGAAAGQWNVVVTNPDLQIRKSFERVYRDQRSTVSQRHHALCRNAGDNGEHHSSSRYRVPFRRNGTAEQDGQYGNPRNRRCHCLCNADHL